MAQSCSCPPGSLGAAKAGSSPAHTRSSSPARSHISSSACSLILITARGHSHSPLSNRSCSPGLSKQIPYLHTTCVPARDAASRLPQHLVTSSPNTLTRLKPAGHQQPSSSYSQATTHLAASHYSAKQDQLIQYHCNCLWAAAANAEEEMARCTAHGGLLPQHWTATPTT